ncbi:MAG: AAA family ATPase [Clostridia bacterium]|nr:AAA family ATPase [Clostridia bacterium]
MEFSIQDIDLRSLIKDIMKNAIFIILAAVTGFLAVTAFYTYRFEPEYTSTATLYVTTKNVGGSTLSSLYLTKEMAGTFTEVFESSALKKEVAKDLGVESINGNISVDFIPETNLITLKVVSDSPKNAYLIINSALNQYVNVSDYLYSNANLSVLKNSTIPQEPSNSLNYNLPRILVAFMLVCAVAGLVSILSFLRPTVKRTSSAQRNLDGRIVGTIPYTRKFKLSPANILKKNRRKYTVLLTSFELGMPFIEATKRVTTIIRHAMQRENDKVLIITSVTENEGKSTFATNMALSIIQKGYKVLLIDADLKKPALHKIFAQDNTNLRSFTDIAAYENDFSKIPVKVYENLSCVYQFKPVSDSAPKISHPSVEKFMAYARENFDFIIIDTSPVCYTSDFEGLLKYSDTASVVVRQDWAHIGAINDVADKVRSHKKHFAGFVLNLFKPDFRASINNFDYYYKYSRYGYHLNKKKEDKKDDGKVD